MPEAVGVSGKEPSHGYQLRVVQEVLLALLAGEASHGYDLRARVQLALGPLADALNSWVRTPSWSRGRAARGPNG